MLELFSSETTIVLGLGLSDDEDKLLQTAVSLVKKTGSRLVMVHALQPFQGFVGSGDDLTLPYEIYERDVLQADQKEAEFRLFALRDKLPPELMIDVELCRDYPENGLETIAEKLRASLIICGLRARDDTSSSWYEGVSTAHALMKWSKFPVMVIPLNTEIDFATKEHTILAADNLRDEGLLALQAALGLARSISCKQLIHLHVRNTSLRDIKGTVEKIKVGMIEGRLPANPEFESDIYLKQIKSEVKTLMHERLELADKDFAKGLHWSPHVRFGQPVEELQHAVKESNSDILVFGKHHFLRPKGLSLGKIPYKAMVEDHVASIVVPSVAYPQAEHQ